MKAYIDYPNQKESIVIDQLCCNNIVVEVVSNECSYLEDKNLLVTRLIINDENEATFFEQSKTNPVTIKVDFETIDNLNTLKTKDNEIEIVYHNNGLTTKVLKIVDEL